MTSPLQQKLKISGSSVVTANRLADGAVVYRTAEGTWTSDIDSAAVVISADAATALLTAAKADGVQAGDVYLAPVKLKNGRDLPANLLERNRSARPHL